MIRRAGWTAALAGTMACTQPAPPVEDAGPRAPEPSASHQGASRQETRPSAAPRADPPPASAALREDPHQDPRAVELAEAPLVALRMGPGSHRGVFQGTLQGARTGKPVRVVLAFAGLPRAYRRAVAFYRLAHALGITIVPPTAPRRIGFGELGELLERQRAALSLVRLHAAVENDGTVEAAITPATTGREVALNSFEPVAWARWAQGASPAADEDGRMLKAYVEMLVLDYLAAYGHRRAARVDDTSRTLLLTDNTAAFPQHTEAMALDRILRELKAVQRFPRGLRAALARFDRAAAARALSPGGFDTWLIPPRAMVELDERRAGLLTLIDARVTERGEGAVLSL